MWLILPLQPFVTANLVSVGFKLRPARPCLFLGLSYGTDEEMDMLVVAGGQVSTTPSGLGLLKMGRNI